MFTGLGIIGGWLAAVLGLSFYARRKIGARTWRKLHRFTMVAYLLALIHVVGAGTNGTSAWMLGLLTALTAPIVFAFTYRVLPGIPKRSPRTAAINPPAPPAGSTCEAIVRHASRQLRRTLERDSRLAPSIEAT